MKRKTKKLRYFIPVYTDSGWKPWMFSEKDYYSVDESNRVTYHWSNTKESKKNSLIMLEAIIMSEDFKEVTEEELALLISTINFEF